jgi:hypothetical protein
MTPIITFSKLTAPRQVLIRLMQSLNFGTILNLKIINSEVTFDPEPEVMVDIRLDLEAGARSELELQDFNLNTETCRLLSRIDALKDGTIERIVVHGGIPRRVVLRQPLQKVFL